MRYKVGIIGTGNIAGGWDRRSSDKKASTHAKACCNVKGFSLESACDIDHLKLKKFVDEWGIKNSFVDVKSMLGQCFLDVVVISSISGKHFELIMEVLLHENAPKVLFVEKPVCMKKSELVMIKRIMNETKTRIIVNHNYRFHLGLKRIKSVIDSGLLGNLLSSRIDYYGGLINNAVHCIDVFRMLSGEELKVIKAKRGSKGRLRDVCVDAVLQCRLNPKAKVLLQSFDEKFYQLLEMEMRFEKSRVRLLDFFNEIYIDKVIVNKRGENELVLSTKNIAQKGSLCFEEAYRSIKKFLSSGDMESLLGNDVSEVEKTMNLIWDIRRKVGLL